MINRDLNGFYHHIFKRRVVFVGFKRVDGVDDLHAVDDLRKNRVAAVGGVISAVK